MLDRSLISRPQSEALKGFLMLLIILGHLRGINGTFQMYLYCFHVQCFFILPFLWPSKPLTRVNVVNSAVKLMYPYWLWFTLLSVVAVGLLHASAFTQQEPVIPGINNVLLGAWTYITGGMGMIERFCGSQFLWFLPCFFSMTVIRMWWSNRAHSKFEKIAVFSLGVISFYLYSALAFQNGAWPRMLFRIMYAVSPFSVFQGLAYFTLGIATIYALHCINISKSMYYWGQFS